MMLQPVTRTEITPDSTGWSDVDVTSYVDDGSTAGVILEIVNTSATEYDWDVRNNGSTDQLLDSIEDEGHTTVAIGVDDNNVFECYVEDKTAIDVYIIGYVPDANGTFLVNGEDIELNTSTGWRDVDISSYTGDEIATCAFFLVSCNAFWDRIGFRENGSSDTQYGYNPYANENFGLMVPLDENEIFERYNDGLSEGTKRSLLVGWLRNCFESFTNAVDYSTGTSGSWVDTDFSSDVPEGSSSVFIEVVWNTDSESEYSVGFRKNGESYDNYYVVVNSGLLETWCSVDSSRIIEQKIENTNVDLYLWGYSDEIYSPPDLVTEIVEDIGV